MTEDDTGVAQKSRLSQKSTDEIPAQIYKVLYDHEKIPRISGVDTRFKPFKSSKEENTKPKVYGHGCPESMAFIDDNDDIQSIEPIVAAAKCSMVKPTKVAKNILPHSMTTYGPTHIACDSTERHDNLCFLNPDSDHGTIQTKSSYISEPKTASSSFFLPITHLTPQAPEQDLTLPSTFIPYSPLTPDSLVSDDQCGSFSPINESGLFTADACILYDSIPRLSSPDSVMSLGDYRAMSPDSPQRERRVLPADFFSVLDDSQAFSPLSDTCSSPEVMINFTENKLSPYQTHTCDCEPPVDSKHSAFPVIKSCEFWDKYRPLSPDSRVPKCSQPLPERIHKKKVCRAFSPVTSDIELLLENVSSDRGMCSPQSVSIHDFESSDRDCRPFSPESQTSQCSFSFLELLLSEPTRTQLRSQYCDYYLLYSGEISPSPLLRSAPYTEVCGKEVGPDSPITQETRTSDNIPPLPQKCVRSNSYLQPVADIKSISSEVSSCSSQTEKSVKAKKLEEQRNQSYLGYWLSKLEPQSCQDTASVGQKEDELTNEIPNISKEKSVHLHRRRETLKSNSYSDHKENKKLHEISQAFRELHTPKPMIFNFVERQKYNLEFPNVLHHVSNTTTAFLETVNRERNPAVLSAAKPLTYADVVKGIANKKQENILLADKTTNLAVVWTKSVSSEEECSLSPIDEWVGELRPQSPESVESQSELRPLSPDSPVPQFRSAYIDCHVEVTGTWSFTPESTLSDWEGTELCLEFLFDDARPDSPQSVLSDFELDKLFSSRALSPESELSDYDFSLLHDWLLDFRASSPDSVASDEGCSFPPLMTVGQMSGQHCNYYLDYSENRAISPLSTMSDVEDFEFCLEEMFEENRADSPDSLPPCVEFRHAGGTGTSFPLLSAFRPLTYADVVRGVTYNHQADADVGTKVYQWSTVWPSAMSSGEECRLSPIDEWVDELRPQSPESVESQSELRPLSPDSPVPQFRSAYIDCHVEVTGPRSFTPVSTLSDWEGNDLCLEFLFDDARPDSPQSVLSDFQLDKLFSSRALSPESELSDYDFSLLHDWLLDFRASSPESVASVDHRSSPSLMTVGQMSGQHCNYYLDYSENRAISPLSTMSDVEDFEFCLEEMFEENRADSPDSLPPCVEFRHAGGTGTSFPLLSAFRPLTYADVVRGVTYNHQADADVGTKVYQWSTVWTSAMSSEEECRLSPIDEWVDELRPQSPESVESQSELRPLSPDSPVPQFRSTYIDCHVKVTGPRSSTPESTLSDWEGNDLCLEFLFDDARPDSPQSVLSDFQVDKLFSSRALSPESELSDYDFSLLHDWLLDFRASSPESVASVDHRSSPSLMTVGQMSGQHCNYYLDYSENRAISPLSTMSDVEDFEFCLEEMFEENRADSPDSLPPCVEFRHAGGTGTSFPLLSAFRPLTYADVVRGVTYNHQADADVGTKVYQWSTVWPSAMSSEEECRLSPIDEWVDELRPQSPESVESQSELRPLSPDSPVPQFRSTYIDCHVEVTGTRSFTPVSTLSDWEGNDLCLEFLFDDARPDSPQSVLSDFQLDKLFSSRALSPESELSDYDFSLLHDWLLDFRASSPESVASVDHRSSPSLMTVGQMSGQHCNYFIDYSENRAISPLSTMSDVEDFEFCLEEMFEENRADSPDSLPPCVEFRHAGGTGTSFPLLSAFRPLTYADVVRGVTYNHQADADVGTKVYQWSTVWPSAMSSEEECRLSPIDEWVDELRPQSPESVESQSELRPLSPDSPVPQFRSTYIDCHVEVTGTRSSTPESTLSDWEGTELCLEFLFDDARPDSPQSVLSDFELDKLFSSRALSPESELSDYDFSLLHDWLLDFRASSPDSVASDEGCSFPPLMTVGQMSGQHCNYYLDYSENRAISPLSTMSDVEDFEFCLEEMFDENRADSPDSLPPCVESRHAGGTGTSFPLLSAFRPLTYADVVRGMTYNHQADADVGTKVYRWSTVWPSAMSSEEECRLSPIDEWVGELRPQSPESVESQSELRPLSPDSPVPQFRSASIDCHVEVTGTRSFTPESTLSDWEGTDLCLEFLFDETRPDSPQSVLSDFQLDKLFSSRALSPESELSDYDFSLLHDWLLDFRASSPESVASVDHRSSPSLMKVGHLKGQHCNYYLNYSENRAISPLSTMSDVVDFEFCLEEMFEENRGDSPESFSPIPPNHTQLFDITSSFVCSTQPLKHAEESHASIPERLATSFFNKNVSIPVSQTSSTQPSLFSSDSFSANSHDTVIPVASRGRLKPFLNRLMSHSYDPVYRGKCSCCEIQFVQ
ncbi:uncharacterized protein LOC110965686 isoform X2 [Acanthochromis polyacanthus]|uniref:uncharacterized protein LOC110965686 isoform X2 n=2 Tax=Acanthochromis polyacanthus TaxID=80966 RepID=UPI0022348267|nr:uncharacterized protein LOC110965686 isoform X2 [Acanthochromis polyacanthus]